MADINIRVNGEPKALENGTSVAGLIEMLELTGKRIAVELNQDIVPRSEHATTVLRDGDVLEIVHAIGGG